MHGAATRQGDGVARALQGLRSSPRSAGLCLISLRRAPALLRLKGRASAPQGFINAAPELPSASEEELEDGSEPGEDVCGARGPGSTSSSDTSDSGASSSTDSSVAGGAHAARASSDEGEADGPGEAGDDFTSSMHWEGQAGEEGADADPLRRRWWFREGPPPDPGRKLLVGFTATPYRTVLKESWVRRARQVP